MPPPVPHPVSPPSSSRAACTASPSPQLLLPPLLQVPSAFRRGGLKTPGGVPPVRLGVGAAGLWGVGRVPSRPSSPLTPLLLPGRGGGARSRAAQPLAAAAVGKGAPDPAVVSCRERGARGGVASLSRAVSGGGGSPLGRLWGRLRARGRAPRRNPPTPPRVFHCVQSTGLPEATPSLLWVGDGAVPGFPLTGKSQKKPRTTLSGGSLGSCVDEERS